jgi:hypothetical protein
LADNESNSPETGGSQEVPSGVSWGVQYVELALGYLGLLVLIVYPVAVVTTWLRLLGDFNSVPTYAPTISLYAVSLMPTTVIVADTGVALLFSSLISGVVAFMASAIVGEHRLNELLEHVYGDEQWYREMRSRPKGWLRKYGYY